MMSSKTSPFNEGKSKSKPSKSPGRKVVVQKSASSAEGVYSNGRLMHTMTSLVGNVVQIILKDGLTYEGVLKTFSPKLDVVLESVTEVDPSAAGEQGCSIASLLKSLSAKKTMADCMVFAMENIVTLDILDVDLDFAFKDGFKTDTDISGATNNMEEKEFEEWVPDESTPSRNIQLDSLSTNGNHSGWSANDMFAMNERLGVQSSFTGLEGVYSTAIDKTDPDYRRKAEYADKVARDINNSVKTGYRPNEDEDEDGDEENRFAGVRRPGHKPKTNTSNMASQPQIGTTSGNVRSSDEINWRVSGTRSSNKGQYASPKQQFNVARNQQNHPSVQASGQGTKASYDSHPSPHLEVNRRTSNPQVPRTPPKEVQLEPTRQPISFAEAVGQSEVRSTSGQGNPTRPHSHVATEAPQLAPKDVKVSPEVVKAVNVSRVVPDELPRTEVATKKEESTTPVVEVEKETVVKASKLNPNAKSFTFNPAAKPFTPKGNTFSPSPHPPLISTHPGSHPQQQNMPLPFNPQNQSHQQPSHPLVMYPPGPKMVQQQVIGPNGSYLINPVLVNQMTGNPNPYNHGYHQSSGQPRKPHYPREAKQGSGHSRHDNNSFNQHNPHNVAAATGHPVLAGAPLTAPGQMQYNPHHHHHQGGPPGPGQPLGPNGQPLFSPMFLQSFAPRMFNMPPQMIGQYGEQQYFMPLSMVHPNMQQQQQQQNQSNNGPNSTPSTPQSQTPSTPGLHGPSTPGPGGHAVVPQTPSPQQQGVMYQGQPMHGPPGAPFNQGMVLMQAPHPGLGPNPHLQSGHVVNPNLTMIPSATNLTSGSAVQIPPHFNQNQPPQTQRPI